MSFIDNSGDIILDAVLTDTGRLRLAKGDGSFKITKFAFADDEIDYGLYNKNHPSGSAFFDLEILRSPVFEAFTNNTSSVKSRLVSFSRNNLLYLPITKLNRQNAVNDFHSINQFLVAVDKNTEDNIAVSTTGHVTGIMFGQKLDPASWILVEQGLDTTEIPATLSLDPELIETQYIVEIDNRLGKIVDINQAKIQTPSFIDDDNIASYFFSLGTTSDLVIDNWQGKLDENTSDLVIRGPRGTRLQFMIASSIELATSTFLFEQLGSTFDIAEKNNPSATSNARFIDTTVRVSGATTGFSLEIPVRFIKRISS